MSRPETGAKPTQREAPVQPVPSVRVPEQQPAMRWIVPGDFRRSEPAPEDDTSPPSDRRGGHVGSS